MSRRERAELVVDGLRSANAGLTEAARKSKYRKMKASPFAFFRGTNHLFWRDFAADPRLRPEGDPEAFGAPTTRTWVGGDAHVANFGAFGNGCGKVVYALNDFDEAIIHDYRYDLWRMAVSVVLVARPNGGFSAKDQRRLVTALTRAYLAQLAAGGGSAALIAEQARGRLRRFLEGVEQRDEQASVKRWTRRDGDGRRFDQRLPELDTAPAAERAALEAALAEYAAAAMYGRHDCEPDDFVLEDVAQRRDAGIGSLGRRRSYVLIRDRRPGRPDHRILDVKEQLPPAARSILTEAGRAAYDGIVADEGRRHAAAFHAMTPHPDPFLGWLRMGDTAFSVRERSPLRRSFDTGELTSVKRFRRVAEQWGALLAAQHMLGDRNIASQLEDHLGVTLTDQQRRLVALDHQLAPAVLDLTAGREDACCALAADVAATYADQVEVDWRTFRRRLA